MMQKTIMFGFSPVVLLIMNGLVNYLFGYGLVLETEVVGQELRLEVFKSNEAELELSEVTMTVLFGDELIYEGEFISNLELPFNDEFANRTVDITTVYDQNMISFTHSDLDLTPTPNSYEVSVSHKSKSATETIETETTYEIKETNYYINDEVVTNEPINMLELEETENLRVEFTSFNDSISSSETPIFNPEIFVSDVDNVIKVRTNTETDQLFINGVPTHTFDKSSLADTIGPDTPTITYDTSDTNYDVVLKFSSTQDNPTPHILDVSVESDLYKKSQRVETEVKSGLKGYYYAVGSAAVADVSQMTYTNDLTHTVTLSKGSHVVSVIAQDNAGNLSKPAHTTISLVDLEKKALVSAVYPSGASSEMTNKLLNVSSNILNFLKNKGVVIKTASNLNQYLVGYASSYSGIKAVYVNSTDQMMFREKNSTDLRNILNAHFYHELGHAIDDNSGDPAMSYEFKEIYNSGKEVLFPGNSALNVYFKTNVWEYFAECVNLYYTNRAALQRHEASYQFIKNHLTSYGL